MEEHNFYGNVSFVVDWLTLLREMGPHLYLIDQAIYNTRSYTRILLTNRIHHDLEPLDLQYGCVIFYDYVNYCHIAKAMCLVKSGPHEVQVAIECNNQRAKRMFELCSVQPNNHSQANTLARNPRRQMNGTVNIYQPYKCFKYNTSMNKSCPDNCSFAVTEDKIFSLTSNVNFHDGRISNPPPVFITPKSTNKVNKITNENVNWRVKSNSDTFAIPKPSTKLYHSGKSQSIVDQTTNANFNDPCLQNSSSEFVTAKAATKLNKINNATLSDREKSDSVVEFATPNPVSKFDQSEKTQSIIDQTAKTKVYDLWSSNVLSVYDSPTPASKLDRSEKKQSIVDQTVKTNKNDLSFSNSTNAFVTQKPENKSLRLQAYADNLIFHQEKSNCDGGFITPKPTSMLDQSAKTKSIVNQTPNLNLNDPWLSNITAAEITPKSTTKINQITNATLNNQEKSFITSKPASQFDQSANKFLSVSLSTNLNFNDGGISNFAAAPSTLTPAIHLDNLAKVHTSCSGSNSIRTSYDSFKSDNWSQSNRTNIITNTNVNQHIDSNDDGSSNFVHIVENKSSQPTQRVEAESSAQPNHTLQQKEKPSESTGCCYRAVETIENVFRYLMEIGRQGCCKDSRNGVT